MDRREVLKTSTLLLGYALTSGTTAALLGGCKASTAPDWKPSTLNDSEMSVLAEICETILPKTDTPGAKDALCHRYIDEMITNFYDKEAQDHFRTTLKAFDKESTLKFSKAFVALTPGEKEVILDHLSKQALEYKDETGKKPHIFNTIKQATISGYFTSEVGAKGGLCEFIPIPGPYQGCMDYSKIGKGYVL
ncbi:MAG TPA: gluconate 2-dehydrogenase subunit 3 family protein [Saprospiraceae bacterium]|jgi:hypothetical protein|nr:gluconate 2-dehydrogenase subunit 3 family protein [Saprospiraceae bacterium]HRO09620.1 gluconate 2-dehydrogenase subunit 3 family protein [Saprospiraceae bacterium]HRP42874.1 gluconate 2-dehydrogenase subunit 3 family protein [Saprospiraceae bacterium]